MIPYCLESTIKWFFQTSATNVFLCFSVSFLPVLNTIVNYPKTWFTRSFLAQSAHKSNKIYNKIQNIWFPLPTYSFLQLPKQCLRKNVVLLNFWDISFQLLKLFWLRITDEGSVPEMRIWSILQIISDLKWCIHVHLSRSLFIYFNYLVSVTADGPVSPQGHM